VLLDGTLIVIAYLLGSLSSAVITSRLLGLPDPRTRGSGNPGATNVLRIGGKKAAVVTLLGDLSKGFLAIALGRAVGAGDSVLAMMGLAAFLGHLYPLFFGFKGGKGVPDPVVRQLAHRLPAISLSDARPNGTEGKIGGKSR